MSHCYSTPTLPTLAYNCQSISTPAAGEGFLSLPQSVEVIFAVGNDTQDDIILITQTLASLPNLKYAILSLNDVSADITFQLEAAFQLKETVIINRNKDLILPEGLLNLCKVWQ